MPLLLALLGGLGYLAKESMIQRMGPATLIVRVTGCAGVSKARLNGSEEYERVSPGTGMARFNGVERGPNSLQVDCEGFLPWYAEVDVSGGAIQDVTADVTAQKPNGVPGDVGNLSATVNSVTVNKTCDSGSQRVNAELRWVISLGDQEFASAGITRIPPAKPFLLENVTLATEGDQITVVVEMWEYDDNNRAVGSRSRQETVVRRSDFSDESSFSRVIRMWPGSAACDVRVNLTARNTS
jgi:hypothetical protein